MAMPQALRTLNDRAALLAAVLGHAIVRRFELIELIPALARPVITFRTIAVAQVLAAESQMTMPTA
jgi:hypothetical protein